jgi:GABA(A) receptor-associated protein
MKDIIYRINPFLFLFASDIMISQFKASRDFLSRRTEAENIHRTWPDKLPLLLEKEQSSKIGTLIKPKLLCPDSFSVQQFQGYLRKKINLPRSSALFIVTEGGILLSGDRMMVDIYMKYKDEDGFLYLKYGDHSVFG